MGERTVWAVVVTGLAALAFAEHGTPDRTRAPAARPRPPLGTKLDMAALHAQGGVPLGWQPTLPPGDPRAGRRSFDALGCPACHRVAGETFASDVPEPHGPELTGMGTHHPPAYFAEAIMNPDAVRIDGPGYLDADGRSIMPAYDTMTLGELADVVAYLTSLRTAEPPSCHAGAPATAAVTVTSLPLADRPPPPATPAHAFFAQSYDVLPGRLADFEAWFARRGRSQFLDADGVLGIETFVDAAKPGAAVTTLFAFRDEAALRTFMGDPGTAEVWREFDGFIGPHGHLATERPIVYRAESLSAP